MKLNEIIVADKEIVKPTLIPLLSLSVSGGSLGKIGNDRAWVEAREDDLKF